jgi:hypothetical protein
MTASPHGPSLDRVAIVARALGDLAGEVVFIGGAIAPLLQIDPPFREARVPEYPERPRWGETYAWE